MHDHHNNKEMQRGQTVRAIILTTSLLLLVVSVNANANVVSVNVNGSANANANANAFDVNTANTNASGKSVTLNVNGSTSNTANANVFDVNTANTNASGKGATLNVNGSSYNAAANANAFNVNTANANEKSVTLNVHVKGSTNTNTNANGKSETLNVNGSSSNTANANAFNINTSNTNASRKTVTLNVNGSNYNAAANANAFNVNTANANGKSVHLNVHGKGSANANVKGKSATFNINGSSSNTANANAFNVNTANANTSEARVFLEAHNFVRRQNKQLPLTWDDKLARHSEFWASTQAAGDCKMIHSDKTKRNFSESLFWGTKTHWTATDAVKAWADEAQFYDMKVLKCKENETCGHFTQIVWRNTTRLGCSRRVCTNNSAVFVVCNYEPKGNYQNVNPFTGLLKPNSPSPSTPLPSSSQSKGEVRTMSDEHGVLLFTSYSELEWLLPSPPHQPLPSNSPPNTKTPLHTLKQKVGHNGPGPGHHLSHGDRGFGRHRQPQPLAQQPPPQPKEI